MMAQISVPIASFADGLVVISIRYNDQTLAINQISAVNNSDHPVMIRATKPGYPAQERTIQAHTSQTQNLANLDFLWVEDEGLDEDGEPLGYNLSLGDIALGCRWPA